MDQDDDPYQVLGISDVENATDSQIRQAYRKLALQHHPDKQTTPEAKAQANQTFAKISNAYELLKDEASRRAYEERKRQSQNQSFASSSSSSSFPQQPFGSAFHDPFQVFQEFFGQSFNQGISMNQNNLFHDPFFGGGMNSFFGGGMTMMGNSLFGSSFRDPSFLGGTAGFGGNTTTTSFMSSSSSSMMGGVGQQSISTSTTTRVINGRSETVQETFIQKPDGSVERKTQVLSGNGNSSNQRLEPDKNARKRALPAPSSSSPAAASPQNKEEQKEEGGESKPRTAETKDDPSSQKQNDEHGKDSKRPPLNEDKEQLQPSSTTTEQEEAKEEETASSADHHDPQHSVQQPSLPKKQKV